jgi:phosphatidylserine/phosphatidylglycerophosphate/cardiolipin synthase-like enzyme
MRHHVTSAFEFQTTGILLAGSGEHEIRVLGAIGTPTPPGSAMKEAIGADAEVFAPYFSGAVKGDQQDPDERPFHPEMPAPFLTRSGELAFLERDWSGIDLDSVVIPALPETPGEDPVDRWRRVLGSDARDGNDVVELIDGPETFRAMHAAILTATGPEHYVYLLGWWLDLDEPLDVPTTGPACPPPPRTGPSTIRSLFTAASAAGVQVRVVLWDQVGTKNSAEVAFVNSLANGAAVLDNHQFASLIGSHHQKVVVVKGDDGVIAFCGGLDVNMDRICPRGAPGPVAGSASGEGDEPAPADQPVTVASSGGSGGRGNPQHDIHCRIAGPAAHDLLGVFVKRWLSTREHVALDAAKGPLRGIAEPVPGSAGPAVVRVGETYNADATLPPPPSPPPWPWWPAAGPQSFRDRTVQEILIPVIAGARRFIYIEDQYLIGMCAAEAIRNALPNVDHVTILIAASEISDLPRRWELRKRFLDRIRSHSEAAKLRVFFLCDPAAQGMARFGDHTYVHAKTLVADDEIAVIGSANVNRRGWEHDSEVVAAVVGAGRDGTPVARRLRTRQWAEHLGVPQAAVADPIASKGLWTTAPARRVCPYDPTADTDPLSHRLIGEDAIDPPFPLATAPCCAIHPASCPPGTPPPTTTPAPVSTPVPTP